MEDIIYKNRKTHKKQKEIKNKKKQKEIKKHTKTKRNKKQKSTFFIVSTVRKLNYFEYKNKLT